MYNNFFEFLRDLLFDTLDFIVGGSIVYIVLMAPAYIAEWIF